MLIVPKGYHLKDNTSTYVRGLFHLLIERQCWRLTLMRVLCEKYHTTPRIQKVILSRESRGTSVPLIPFFNGRPFQYNSTHGIT
jgi:hypothetical protein